ncbi:MAG: sodium:solute symporter family protein [Cyclobacteriaceae bacterium]|nr:sodium:solute symporter family protein [Cytophagales bacterium]MCZ8327680.1 sodium:solute symporter family protein [Cyclobacteriaceae bacterium]
MRNTFALLLASILFYLAATIGIGFWAARKVKGSGDFLLAGRSLPIVLSTAALFATWFGSETVFGASSRFLEGGLFAVIEDPFGAALCLLLFGYFFARKLYNMNLLTLGDLFKVRYGKRIEVIASVFMVPAYFGYTAGQLVALGLIANVVIGIPVWQGVVISAVAVTLYTYVGGMWAISVTDFVQSILIVLGLVILLITLLTQAGGLPVVLEDVPAGTFQFFPEFTGNAIVHWICAWSVLGLGSIPSQDVFQRTMSSGSAKIAERSCYYAAILYLTIAILPLLISLCVRHLYPTEIHGDTQVVLLNMVIKHTPLWVQMLFFGSLLSAIMSTTSSSMLAPAALVSENIIKPLTKNRFTDKQLLYTTRTSLLVFSAISSSMACINSDIYELVGGSSILSLVSLFVPMVAGLYWQKATGFGALLSMVSGLSCWFYLEFYPASLPSMIYATGLSAIGMVAGSYISKRYSFLQI